MESFVDGGDAEPKTAAHSKTTWFQCFRSLKCETCSSGFVVMTGAREAGRRSEGSEGGARTGREVRVRVEFKIVVFSRFRISKVPQRQFEQHYRRSAEEDV